MGGGGAFPLNLWMLFIFIRFVYKKLWISMFGPVRWKEAGTFQFLPLIGPCILQLVEFYIYV